MPTLMRALRAWMWTRDLSQYSPQPHDVVRMICHTWTLITMALEFRRPRHARRAGGSYLLFANVTGGAHRDLRAEQDL